MTGWRLGWLVLPSELVAPVTRLAQNLFISAPAIAQHAALGAMADAARAGAARRALPPQPGSSADGAAEGGPDPHGSGGRRLLPLRRHQRVRGRFGPAVPPTARRDGRCADARCRLRPRAWPSLRAPVLCRPGGRGGHGRRPPLRVAAARPPVTGWAAGAPWLRPTSNSTAQQAVSGPSGSTSPAAAADPRRRLAANSASPAINASCSPFTASGSSVAAISTVGSSAGS